MALIQKNTLNKTQIRTLERICEVLGSPRKISGSDIRSDLKARFPNCLGPERSQLLPFRMRLNHISKTEAMINLLAIQGTIVEMKQCFFFAWYTGQTFRSLDVFFDAPFRLSGSCFTS